MGSQHRGIASWSTTLGILVLGICAAAERPTVSGDPERLARRSVREPGLEAALLVS